MVTLLVNYFNKEKNIQRFLVRGGGGGVQHQQGVPLLVIFSFYLLLNSNTRPCNSKLN